MAPNEPLARRCRPRTSLGCLFPEAEVAGLRAWLRGGATGPALATAGPGAGLTTLAALLARECGLEPVWVGCATPRVRDVLRQAATTPVTVTMRRKLVVVDEFDAFSSSSDTSATADALAFAKAKPAVPALFLSHSARGQKAFEFAKGWPTFHMGRPTAPRVHAYLRAACAAHDVAVGDDALAEVARQTRGDLRAALNAAELLGRGAAGGEAPPVKDETCDGLDLTEAVLRGERGRGVAECLRLFGMESAVLPAGIFENYLQSLTKGDADAAAQVAAAFSDADRVEKYMYAHQAWDLHDAYGACAVAAPCLLLARRRVAPPDRGLRVAKFGSVWSKAYNACAKAKSARALALAYATRGLATRAPCDLALVRACVRGLLEAKAPDEELRRACAPLEAAQVLALARLDVGGSAWYKQSFHARVKRALA